MTLHALAWYEGLWPFIRGNIQDRPFKNPREGGVKDALNFKRGGGLNLKSLNNIIRNRPPPVSPDI